MAVGIYVQLKVGDLAELQTVKFLTGSILIIAVGAVIAVVSFFGCCGAVKENRCFLCLIETNLNKDLNKSLIDYGRKDHDDITKAYDTLQQQEKCCGINNYRDWQRTPFSNGSHSVVPDSCCQKKKAGCGKNFQDKDIYGEGCYVKVKSLLKDNLMVIFGVGLAVAFIQVLAMIFSMVLICKISKQSEYA
ncbi:CD63 antigen [Exaiptasia diaphana]|uniref:Tetraspanin n=1 Tax=Exaiptasia diaphana TaxID=2652724 RepID=A0A913YU45_EXADI|nr:CD63 antigen [Exaiptasia diaphana]